MIVKQNDYSEITSLAQLRKYRANVDRKLRQTKKSVKTDYIMLKKSLTFTNLVAIIIEDIALFAEELDSLRRTIVWLRNIFSDKEQPPADNRKK
ncbi:MAG: hypothetical protein IKA41_03700 [Bacteroidaceae bacterium]|nr:hypothetical protein [Bacteroidaceae bacterium]